MIQCGHICCGRDFAADQGLPASDRISLTVVDGSYAKAQAIAEEFAAQRGITWVGGFFNSARREGLKLVYLDAFGVMNPQPDILVQAISSGMGIMAARKGAREYLSLGRVTGIPRFLMVQQDTSAAIAAVWHESRLGLGDEDVVDRPHGLARAILLGDCRASFPIFSTS
jgi:threonine synthase